MRSLLRRTIPLWLAVACLWPDRVEGSVPLVQITPTLYQTEHCLFVIDSTVTWSSPATAYNDIYGVSGGTFPRLASCFSEITTRFPANYFSVCYIANTGASNVPNYIDRIYKATGISSGIGSSGLGTSGDPNTPQSFASVDMCRYNLPGGNVITPVLGVFDHEIGHAWGAQIFYFLNPPSLCNGHWLPNSTVDCQLDSDTSTDGYLTVEKIYGDTTSGFRWQRVDNARNNDYSVFSEQTLYLLGVSPRFPTSYVLNNPVYNADLTMGYDTVDTFDHTAAVATYGVRNPDYKTSPKQFKLGFVYIARDLNEVNTVYQAVEQSIDQFCNAEAISTTTYRSQTPFLVDTRYRASVNGLLSDLDGNATPAITVTNTYVLSTDGTASVGFAASDPDGPAPTVSVVPASSQCSIVGNVVHVGGLPDGVHFFTLKAEDSGGKKAFGHFVVEVQRAAGSISVTAHPSTQTAVAGTTAHFAVVVNGDAPTLAYEWFRQAARTSTWNPISNGGAYSGADTAALAVSCTTAMDGDRFLCLAGDVSGVTTSHDAALVVNEIAPVLTAQPADKSITAGNSTFFRVTVGDPVLNFGYFQYQWQRQAAGSGVWTDLVAGGNYSAVNSNQLGVTGATSGMNADQFRCLITDTAGTTTSNAATLSIGVAPAISVQPQPITGLVGQTISFTVTVTGTAPLTYQWYLYGTPVGNAATLTLTNIQPADAGTYGVTITNAFGLAYSNNVGLTVNTAAPVFTTHPAGQSVFAGAPVTFTAAASGGPPPTYQWRKNGSDIIGATSATYTIPGATSNDAGSYAMVATNTAGSVTSNSAVLAVVTPVASDFDGDSTSDIVVQNGNEIWIWLMNGMTFDHAFYLFLFNSSGSKFAATGDFNSDGKPDIVYQDTLNGALFIWVFNGYPEGITIWLGNIPVEWKIACAGDFNHDGKPDLVWQNLSTGERVVWLMNGTAYSSTVFLGTISTDWTIVGAADFNGDGQTDLLWRNLVTGEDYIWLMNGTTFLSAVALETVTPLWAMADIGDFNGDGKSDILWTNTVTGERAYWLMNGTAHTATIPLGVASIDWVFGHTTTTVLPTALPDFNGDGKVDILWQNTATGERAIWYMNGTIYAGSANLQTVPPEWSMAATADFNGDGKPDILWQNTTTGERYVWFMNGATHTGDAGLGVVPTEWSIAAAADFTGDGRPDILWQNTVTGERYVWLMYGTVHVGDASLGVMPTEWSIAAAADFDGNGSVKILWQNTITGERYRWFMHYLAHLDLGDTSLEIMPTAWSIAAAADYNGDGKPDILWQNTSTGERFVWFMNHDVHTGGLSLGVVPTDWKIVK